MGLVRDAFTQSYLNSLNAINLRLDSAIKGSYSGNRRSKAKGSSVEFSDFRNYIKGDDVRRIDWNSYARLNKLFIRLFEEEKQATINIFIDKSSSMDFGEPNKFVFAKIMAASLAYIAVSMADRVSIFTINDKLSVDTKSLSSKAAFGKILDYLDILESTGKTSINSAFESIGNINLGDGLSILLSDFFDPAGYEYALKALKRKTKQVCAMQILSPQELVPTLTGGVRLKDLETGADLDMDIDDSIILQYLKELEIFNKSLEYFCKKNSIEYMLVGSGTSQIQWITKLGVM